MDHCEETRLDGALFEKCVAAGADHLQRNVQSVNDLNVFPIPDGDTGDNMFRTLSGGVREMRGAGTTLGEKASSLAQGMLLSARGNSGVILSQIFAGIGQSLRDKPEATVAELSAAFSDGMARAYASVVTPVEGTILTVGREAIEQTAQSVGDETTLGEFSRRLLTQMQLSLSHTPELLAVLKEAGVVDSGGAGLYLIAEGAANALRDDRAPENEPESAPEKETSTGPDLSLFTEESEFRFGYCTEFLLRLMNAKTDPQTFDVQTIVSYLKTIGDSIVALRDGTIVKVHVHTFTPDKALAFCRQFGEFLTVKIENMMLQHSEHETRKSSALPVVQKKRAKNAVCAVTTGAGMIRLFKELGADVVIDGGQGKNPSIRDFLEAFDALNADNVFVFPNNSNIVLAAQQAANLYDASRVYVIPSKNPGQAYAALSMLDYSFDTPEEIARHFEENMEYVSTGMVCRAVRDVEYKDLTVKNDDYIGFTNKTVLSADRDKIAALIALCRRLQIDEHEIVTVIYGAGATGQDRQKTKEAFASLFPEKEFYEIEGEQEAFDLIVILE